MSNVTDKLAKYNISIKKLIQTPDHQSKTATIVMTTHKTTEINIQKCLRIIDKNKDVLKFPTFIRIHG